MPDDSDNRPSPAALYKYRPINEFTERMITADEFFFASPTSFNDPFDTLPSVVIRGSPLKREVYLRRLVRENMAGEPRAARQSFMRATKRVSKAEQESWLRTSLAETTRNVGVCCFAEAPDDMLMWSHYADHHAGICVEVDLRREYFRSRLPFPVRYTEQRPIFDPTEEDHTASLMDKLATKASCWAYEREWRMVEPSGVRAHCFPPSSITAVYLGCRISDGSRELVRMWLSGRQNAPKVFQMSASREAFRLDVASI
jgi:hypothetical protein